MSNEKKPIIIIAGIIGGIAGGLAGLIGDDFIVGLISGAITSVLVGIFFPSQPRDFNSPRIDLTALSPAGLVGGIVASVSANAGWFGAFLSGGSGWVLGLILPTLLIAIFRK